MSYLLTKKFRFESAHRLIKGYVGKCNQIHGHSWHGHIALRCEGVDEHDMSVDFKKIGTICKEIEAQFDHKLLLCADDTEIISLCRTQGLALHTFDANPTCEAIARYIYEYAAAALPLLHSGVVKVSMDHVHIEETCTSSCRYDG
jgi:6-pyruvoyltetrahydropterin/6-carboxytetrahydropterin synthase